MLPFEDIFYFVIVMCVFASITALSRRKLDHKLSDKVVNLSQSAIVISYPDLFVNKRYGYAIKCDWLLKKLLLPSNRCDVKRKTESKLMGSGTLILKYPGHVVRRPSRFTRSLLRTEKAW